MKRVLLVLVIGIVSTCSQAAQTTASNQASTAATSSAGVTSTPVVANAGTAALAIPSGTKIDATLATSLDAKRSRPGDDVEVRTEEELKEDGKVILKKGAHLVGHVTQTQAFAAGKTQSQLGIVFDHVLLKDGQEVPFSASIQAIASAQSSAGSGDAMDASGTSMQALSREHGGVVNAVASNAGGATSNVVNAASSAPVILSGSPNTVPRSLGSEGGLTSKGRLAPDSSGVFGLQGLSIGSAASTMQGSIIVSATKNVHLDSGTQLLLVTAGPGQ